MGEEGKLLCRVMAGPDPLLRGPQAASGPPHKAAVLSEGTRTPQLRYFGYLHPGNAWVSWGARCGCAVALNQQLDPAMTASNPPHSLAQGFYTFSSGSRGAWRQRLGETGLTLASREGRGKGKHFPSKRSRGA